MSVSEIPSTLPRHCEDEVLLNDWHPIGMSNEFVAGKLAPVKLLGRDLVVWRESNGRIHVWEDLCVHRGTRLSLGTICDDKVICPYHGWNYAASGQCVLMPASPNDSPMKKARAFPYLAQERYEMVWACLGTPSQGIPDFPEWDDPTYRTVSCGPWAYNASGYRAIENFMDATHLPFVHAGLNGLPDKPDVIAPYEVWEENGGLATSEIKTFQPFGDPRNIPVYGYYAYKVFRPLCAYFAKRVVVVDDDIRREQGGDNDFFCIMLTAQLVDETHCIVRQNIAMNFKNQPSDQDVRARQDLVIGQDRAIVESQRPEQIPTALHYELHHRTDLLGQRYRKWLHGLGIRYGVI